MKSSPLRRRTTAATTVLLLGLTLTACGDDSGDSSGDDSPADETTTETTSDEPSASTESTEPTESTESESVAPSPAAVPTEAELEAALLTTADLPAGFEQAPGDDDESEDTFEGTCLADVGEFEDALGKEPDAEAETEFTQEDASGQAFVGSKITAYADPAPVAAEFTSFVDVLQKCTDVQATEDGVDFDLQIAYDEALTVPGAEQQVTISMTGTVTGGGESFPLGYTFVIALTGGFISIVGGSEVGESATGVLASANDLALLQAERLEGLGG